jgi:hypothetical protein
VALHGRAQPPAHHGRRRTFRQKTVRPSSDAHEAVLAMDPLADERAPGAAVTVAPCGHWDHVPPCPLTPHHSRADRVDGEVRVRTLFVVEPELEDTIRHGVEPCTGQRTAGPPGWPDNPMATTEQPAQRRPEQRDGPRATADLQLEPARHLLCP